MTILRISRHWRLTLGLAAALTAPLGGARAQPLEKLTIVIFSAAVARRASCRR